MTPSPEPAERPGEWHGILRRRWLMYPCLACLCLPALVLLAGAAAFAATVEPAGPYWTEPVISVFCRDDDVTVKGAALAVDPAVALGLLRFYAARPEARGELATDAARWRAAEGAFYESGR